ncbi:hypothetical protein BGZ47_000109, partial [Haplosporangium gracile]
DDVCILRLQSLLELLLRLYHYSCDQATPVEFFNILEFLPNLKKLTLEYIWRSHDPTLSSEDPVTSVMARIRDRLIQLRESGLTWTIIASSSLEDPKGTVDRYIKPMLPPSDYHQVGIIVVS